jgi:hypothetical protein
MPDRIDAIDAALTENRPDRPQLSESAKEFIREWLATAEQVPLAADRAARLSRLWNGGLR